MRSKRLKDRFTPIQSGQSEFTQRTQSNFCGLCEPLRSLRETFRRIIFFLGAILSITVTALSQPENPSVKLQARATQQSVKLRWAPNTPVLWQLANTYGYTVERIALTVNNQVVQNPAKVILNNNRAFKPASQNSWEPLIDSDDYVAVAAQAIFGESFEVTDNSNSVMKMVNKAKELESRFSFALFSADQSLKAAELSGLYFEDATVAAGTKYLYRVYANVPAEIVRADTGFVYIGLQDYQPLPQPPDVRVAFEDRTALISWNGGLLDKTYNSFWVERSEDGAKIFRKITEQPVVNTFPGDQPRSPIMYRTDSLPTNDREFYYRVIGINAFGETGPPSDTVSGSGRSAFAYSASITKHLFNQQGHAIVEWSFPTSGESLLKSFDLVRVDQATKMQIPVRNNINRTVRSVVDESPRSSNYYVVRANDKYGRSTSSFPYLVQAEDSIPPLPPLELIGRIDTLGRVLLGWKQNEEDDLLGYHVFKSNFKSDEFIQVPGPIVKENAFVDTIRLNTLTEKIYYKIQAVDKRFNPSGFSAVLELEKPDFIPPVPPVFMDIRSDSTGIVIGWQRSGSEDVVKHLLYRRSEDESDWSLVKTFPVADTTNTYKDSSVEHRKRYAYTMLAVDDDQLESVPAEPVIIRWMDTEPYPEIENIFHRVDKSKKSVIISWNYTPANIDRFLIYKAANGSALKLFKAIAGNEFELRDEYKSGSSVEYRIVAAFKTGERTRISRAVIVKM